MSGLSSHTPNKPPQSPRRREAKTKKRMRFFDAYDKGIYWGKTGPQIYVEQQIPARCKELTLNDGKAFIGYLW